MTTISDSKLITVTRDSGASVRVLRELEKAGYIKIYDVMLENGRHNKKVSEKVLPVAVMGHAIWGEAVWTADNCTYDEIRNIIGKNNVKDAMQLEAHIRNNHDYFVTEDTDFLNKRVELGLKFDVKIVTPTELKDICQK
jgi:predicted nucleic acid-binding protein